MTTSGINFWHMFHLLNMEFEMCILDKVYMPCTPLHSWMGGINMSLHIRQMLEVKGHDATVILADSMKNDKINSHNRLEWRYRHLLIGSVAIDVRVSMISMAYTRSYTKSE